MQLNSVVLPAPFGPISPQISPGRDLEGGAVEGDDAPEAHDNILDGQQTQTPRCVPSTGGQRTLFDGAKRQ